MLAANPLLALLAVFAAGAAPGAAVWAGSRLSSSFADAAGEPGFLRVLAAGVCLPAVVAGLSVALLAPGPEALGPQVAAAPRSRAALATGAVVAPFCAAGCVLALLLTCFAVPLAGTAGFALVLLALGGAGLGAAVGEGARLVTAGEVKGTATLAGAAALWLGAGVPGDRALAFGPVGLVGARSGLAALAAVAAGGVALWVGGCGVARRERAPTRDALVRRLPARAAPAVAVATGRRVLRHPELRLHGITAVGLPLAIAVAARFALGAPGASATVFCVAVTLTATALYPPAALGLARGARWLLAAAPRRRWSIAGAAATGGVAAAGLLLAATALFSAPLGVPELSIYLELEGAAAFVLGCAALAGAVVAWDADRVLHQLASYAAVLAMVVAAWLVVGRLEDVTQAGTWFGVAAGNAVLVLGVVAAAVVSR